MSTRSTRTTNIVSVPSTPVKTSKAKTTVKKEEVKASIIDNLENALSSNVNIVTPIPSRIKIEKKTKSIPQAKQDEEDADSVSVIAVPVIDEESIVTVPMETIKEAKKIEISPAVKRVYKIVSQKTGALGGNGYNGAIYGELTVGSMQRVINVLVDKCEMNHTSRFIDVGSGLGKPNFHASQSPCVRLSLGIELETIRWQLAMHNLDLFVNTLKSQNSRRSAKEEKLNGGVNFICGDIDTASSMDPFTHIYMYDLGFPPPLQKSIANKFNNSVHARYLVSYRPPRRVIEEYGYNVEYVDRILTSMYGSGEGHTAYFYKRIGVIPDVPTLPNQKSLSIPARNNFEEETIEVTCDEAFYKPSFEATQDFEALTLTVKTAIDEHLNGGRSKRTTRASTRFTN